MCASSVPVADTDALCMHGHRHLPLAHSNCSLRAPPDLYISMSDVQTGPAIRPSCQFHGTQASLPRCRFDFFTTAVVAEEEEKEEIETTTAVEAASTTGSDVRRRQNIEV